MNLRKSMFAWLVIVATLAGLSGLARAAEAFTVQFRLTNWKSAHVHDPQEAATVGKALAKIGCETRQDQHGNHIDLVYRCPQWRAIQVASDDAAHSWEGWLQELGFETSHQH